MPAAAVKPASFVYMNIVAIRRIVVSLCHLHQHCLETIVVIASVRKVFTKFNVRIVEMNCRGCQHMLYLSARGEILRFGVVRQLRRRCDGLLLLIKVKSLVSEDD